MKRGMETAMAKAMVMAALTAVAMATPMVDCNWERDSEVD